MIIQSLKKDLLDYIKTYPEEEQIVDRFFKLISIENPQKALNRKYFSDGHITTSAALLNPDKTKVLLTNHKFLKIWIQLGGHFENDESILASAIREAKEESGIQEITSLFNQVFDLDIHLVPERMSKKEPAHFHYDVKFILISKTENFFVSDESDNLAWIDISKLSDFCPQDMKKLIKKIHNFVK